MKGFLVLALILIASFMLVQSRRHSAYLSRKMLLKIKHTLRKQFGGNANYNPKQIHLGTLNNVFRQYEDSPGPFYNDEDHPERAYGYTMRSHTTIFPDGSSETKENEYIRDIVGMVLPRNGRKQTEIENGRGATSPIRVYKANGERLVPPKEGVEAQWSPVDRLPSVDDLVEQEGVDVGQIKLFKKNGKFFFKVVDAHKSKKSVIRHRRHRRY